MLTKSVTISQNADKTYKVVLLAHGGSETHWNNISWNEALKIMDMLYHLQTGHSRKEEWKCSICGQGANECVHGAEAYKETEERETKTPTNLSQKVTKNAPKSVTNLCQKDKEE